MRITEPNARRVLNAGGKTVFERAKAMHPGNERVLTYAAQALQKMEAGLT